MSGKRLFIGMDCFSPWKESWPAGRLMDLEFRHMTLLFLGNVEIELPKIPPPPFHLGLVGQFTKPLALSRVMAWEVDLLEKKRQLFQYQKKLAEFFNIIEKRPFLPHVTLARGKFVPGEWKKAFSKAPLFLKDIHLFESLGHSKYAKIQTLPLLSPVEEIEHTADVAYIIRGESLDELYLHAQIALAFQWPPMVQFIEKRRQIENLDALVMALNERITVADSEYGCDLKAVSFHGEIEEKEHLLSWEMIVDV